MTSAQRIILYMKFYPLKQYFFSNTYVLKLVSEDSGEQQWKYKFLSDDVLAVFMDFSQQSQRQPLFVCSIC